MQGVVIRVRASAQMALVGHPNGRCSVVEWGDEARLRPGDRLEVSAEDASYGTVLLSETGQRVYVYCHLFQATADDAHTYCGWARRA